MKNKIAKVVGGIIFDKKKILICQRKEDNDHPFKWEFPGGKVKVSEKPISALTRELREELTINVSNSVFLCDYYFKYIELKKEIHLFFYAILQYHGDIKNNIHKNLKWIEIQDLSNYDFLEGDKLIIQKILNNDFKIY